MAHPLEARSAQAAKERDFRIRTRAQQLCLELRDGTGIIGRRMRVTSEEPLEQELLSRTPHPLLTRTLLATKRALPTDLFRREDGETPHIRHSLRTALLLQDYLTTTDVSLDAQAILLRIALGHDNEEEAQEHLMQGKPGGLTQEQSRALFYEEMTREIDSLEIPPLDLIDQVYAGIHIFNCHNPDNTTKLDEDYLSDLVKAGRAIIKIPDRGMDSPQGDMSRIGREIEGLTELTPFIGQLLERSERSTNKARRLKNLAKLVPKDLQIEFEATIMAGDMFRQSIRDKFTTQSSPHPRRG